MALPSFRLEILITMKEKQTGLVRAWTSKKLARYSEEFGNLHLCERYPHKYFDKVDYNLGIMISLIGGDVKADS